MKLIACHIENFGKLSDLTIEFNDRLNVINEPNAWGKSTLAVFLKVMFYGLDAKKDPKAIEKERKLYEPWQGGVYGGQLDFEIGDRAYRIIRTFGRTEKTDEFHLYDLTTNLESDDFTKDIGAEIFDLDSASFKRSIYIQQNECAGSSTTDAINAKLGNLAENTNDINNFEKAAKKLKDLMNKFSPDRATGSIRKRKNTITQLTQELKGFDAAEESFEQFKDKRDEKIHEKDALMEQRLQMRDQMEQVSLESARQEKYSQYEKLCQEENRRKEAADALAVYFPAGIPEGEEFQEMTAKIQKIAEYDVTLSNLGLDSEEEMNLVQLHKQFAKEIPTEEDLKEKLEIISTIRKGRESLAELEHQENSLIQMAAANESEVQVLPQGNSPLPVIGICGYVVAVLLMIATLVFWNGWISIKVLPPKSMMTLLIGGIAAAVFVILGTICIILGVRKKKKAQKEQIRMQLEKEEKQKRFFEPMDEIRQQMNQMKHLLNEDERNIQDYISSFGKEVSSDHFSEAIYELKNDAVEYRRLVSKFETCEDTKDKRKEKLQELDVFMEKYSFAPEEELSTFITRQQTMATQYQLALDSYQEAKEQRESFEQNNDMEALKRKADVRYTLDELNQQIRNIDAQVELLRDDMEQYNRQMEEMQVLMDLRDEKQQELKAALGTQQQEVHQYEIMDLTSSYLLAAKEKFTARYTEPVSKGFCKYYDMLTGKDEQDWIVDANIEVKVKDQGQLRDTRLLSAGYQDLIGVCMRLALVDAMYTEEKPFLILDDPFVNLDEDKVARGNELIEKISQEYQTIYFTCHSSRQPF
ncbi:MAG: hypothetical protein J6B26_07225 [Agathobacter sp.]|nr:hypothetical protein [Agathobacter sp.]MBQ2283951.1 hypothetical protein [Agathobacter sp.]